MLVGQNVGSAPPASPAAGCGPCIRITSAAPAPWLFESLDFATPFKAVSDLDGASIPSSDIFLFGCLVTDKFALV